MELRDLAALESLGNQGLHNFAAGTIEAYFYFPKGTKLGKSTLFFGNKTFVYSRPSLAEMILIEHSQTKGPIYSIEELPLTKGSKFQEIRYDLSAVFDSAAYKNSKKRHQHLVYPFRWLEREGIDVRFARAQDLPKIKTLHDEWVKHKMKDPKVYKIMFPTGRYIRCVELAAKDLGFIPGGFMSVEPTSRYVLIVAEDRGGTIVAARVLWRGREADAYDLAFFGNVWSAPSQLTNYVEMSSLRLLLDQGVQMVNCGAALNARLRLFKEHLPFDTATFFLYSKRT